MPVADAKIKYVCSPISIFSYPICPSSDTYLCKYSLCKQELLQALKLFASPTQRGLTGSIADSFFVSFFPLFHFFSFFFFLALFLSTFPSFLLSFFPSFLPFFFSFNKMSKQAHRTAWLSAFSFFCCCFRHMEPKKQPGWFEQAEVLLCSLCWPCKASQEEWEVSRTCGQPPGVHYLGLLCFLERVLDAGILQTAACSEGSYAAAVFFAASKGKLLFSIPEECQPPPSTQALRE